jgi:hypothetical protein
MTEFFELPPPPPEAEPMAWEQPVWMAPPENVFGHRVDADLILARTDDVAMGITGMIAYPTGLSFAVSSRRREVFLHDATEEMWHRGPLYDASGHVRQDVVRFGIEFSDGRKATTFDPYPPWRDDQTSLPEGPVLIHRGGGSGGVRSQEHGFWVWPLPPPGPFAFVCEWPSEGIPVTRAQIDAGLIIEAAQRAEVLWENPEHPGSGGWAAYG